MTKCASSSGQGQTVLERLGDVSEVRPFPAMATRLMAACDDAAATPKSFGEIIQCDPGLAARLLRVANSPLYRAGREIRTIEHAASLLGIRALKSLAISVAGAKMFSQGDTAHKQRAELWQHSLGCATVASLMAKHVANIVPEEAFLAGVFHDVGKLVFLDKVPEEYTDLIRSATAGQLVEREEQVFGVTHAQIGQRAAEKWGLTAEIIHGIGYHHSVESTPGHVEFVALVNVANSLARAWEIGSTEDTTDDVPRDATAEQLRLDTDALANVKEQATIAFEETRRACAG